MFHARPTTTGVPTLAVTATALRARRAPETRFRIRFFAIALACCLIAVTGNTRADTQTSEEAAYCTRLYGLYWKFHANFFHHDGTWAQAELARSDCDHGNVELGTKQLERILQDDLFVIPGERSPTYTGSAQR
jgi:hypothetical protein